MEVYASTPFRDDHCCKHSAADDHNSRDGYRGQELWQDDPPPGDGFQKQICHRLIFNLVPEGRGTENDGDDGKYSGNHHRAHQEVVAERNQILCIRRKDRRYDGQCDGDGRYE
jgi:hypothetical protein